MKLTKTKLRRIIKEELQNILDEDNAYLDPPVAKDEEARAAETASEADQPEEYESGVPIKEEEDLEEKKDDKWIQKAVDPEHEGYCTPMTKKTCTPRRKALAKRFKKAARKEKREGGTGWKGKV